MTHEAGEELDRAIGAQVFGWQWVTNPSGREGWASNGPSYGLVNASEAWRGKWIHPLTPHFSTDIKVAWAVVKYMQQGGYMFTINEIASSVYQCKFATPTRQRYAIADTAPLAICRAALAALEEKP